MKSLISIQALDATLAAREADGPRMLIGPVVCYTFPEVDRILGGLRPTTCLYDPCPFWLFKSAGGMGNCVQDTIIIIKNPPPTCLEAGSGLSVLKNSTLELLILLNLSVVLDTIPSVVVSFQIAFWGWNWEAMFCGGSSPTSNVGFIAVGTAALTTGFLKVPSWHLCFSIFM